MDIYGFRYPAVYCFERYSRYINTVPNNTSFAASFYQILALLGKKILNILSN